MSSTTLARVEDITSKPLATVDDLRRTFESLKDRANVVSPVAAVSHVKPLHQISLRAVVIDPTTECYQDKRFCQGDEVALGGVGLSKLMAAAGAQVVQETRLDDRSDPHYCEIEVYVAVQDFDGTWRQVPGTKALDLRKGSEDAKAMTEKELSNARKHIQSLCETKAIYRALRKLLTLRQKYSRKELERPWVVPKLVPHLDLSDPDQKAAAIQDALSTTRALFGPAPAERRTTHDSTPAALPPAVDSVHGQEPRREPSSPAKEEVPASDGAAGDFDLPDFKEKEEQLFVCGCPCGDQVAVTEEVARLTKEKVGGIRCKACYPGAGFDYARHKDLRTLELPMFPKLTADDARKANEDRARATAGGRR